MLSSSIPMDDPHLRHIDREPAARGRSPGWRVATPRGARLFTDTDHGSTGAALDAALDWRDAQLDPRRYVPVPDSAVRLAQGISFTAQTIAGHAYPVIKAVANADGARETITRSLYTHTPEDAIRDAAEMRVRVRRGRPGFKHDSAEALAQIALDAYHAYARTHAPDAAAEDDA